MEVSEAINKRTMVREYSEKSLSKPERERILNAGIRAPTASGNEQWYYVIVNSPKKREGLYRHLIEAQKIYSTRMLKKPWSSEKMEKWLLAAEKGAYKAPFYVAVFVDLRERFCTIPEIEELWAQHSIAAAIENMLLEAWGMGIGGCWFGIPLLMEDKFYDLFGVAKQGLKLAAVLGFGYPKKETKPRERTKKLTDITRVV